MKAVAILVSLTLVSLTLVAAAPAAAAEPLSRTFGAPVDRVWAVAEAVLKHLGWDIDKADPTVGLISTDSRRVEGEDYGVYAKGTRHRLRLQIKAVGDKRASVTVERDLFKRERILFVDKDEPLKATDQTVERGLLDAIGRAL
ncbi:MAG TPA: hypothetical protein VLF19_09500 [Methylomirabilota bacterium]|nr:hypothetical protein [Methylomirabilota bacterium]